MNDNPSAKLTLTMYDVEASITWPQSDLSVDDVINGFIGLMTAHTFLIDSIIAAMSEYIEDHASV